MLLRVGSVEAFGRPEILERVDVHVVGIQTLVRTGNDSELPLDLPGPFVLAR